MSNVNREVLVDRVSENLPDVTKKDVAAVIRTLFNVITDAVVNDEVVNITGFVKISPRVRAARKARNLKTGETIEIGPRKVVSFKAGASLKDRLRESL